MGQLLQPLLFLFVINARAKNPLVPHVGMADPHVRHFGGPSVYMYSTQDLLFENGTSECGGQWWIWQSEDLVHWRNVSQLANFPWEPPDLLNNPTSHWATDAAERNGSYYWYVSVGGLDIAVVSGHSPIGPWNDPLGKFLLDGEVGRRLNPPSDIRDPGILKDDDGTYYIVFGACGGKIQPNDSCYYAAELNEDMISYKTPRHLSVQGALGPYGPGKCDDKPFLHRRGNLYYLSWGAFYATSTAVYGPYYYQGTIIQTSSLAPEFRYGNESVEPWYARTDYNDRHGSFLQWHGQWYFFCNDGSHSDAISKGFYGNEYRDTVAGYVHYYDNGSIAPVVIDGQGVAGHDLSLNSRVPAENYFHILNAEKREDKSSGFEITGLRHGSMLSYANLANARSRVGPHLFASNGGACGVGVVEVRLDDEGAHLFGRCKVPQTGSWHRYMRIPCESEDPWPMDSVHLFLSFVGCAGEEFLRLDHIEFSSIAEEFV